MRTSWNDSETILNDFEGKKSNLRLLCSDILTCCGRKDERDVLHNWWMIEFFKLLVIFVGFISSVNVGCDARTKSQWEIVSDNGNEVIAPKCLNLSGWKAFQRNAR